MAPGTRRTRIKLLERDIVLATLFAESEVFLLANRRDTEGEDPLSGAATALGDEALRERLEPSTRNEMNTRRRSRA